MKSPDWNDLKLFLAVAETGSLSAAGLRHDASPATLGRRMVALERALARPLFRRSQQGYALTPEGHDLHRMVKAMAAEARPIAEWLDPDRPRPQVRISAGISTAQFLIENFAQIWRPSDAFLIAFHTTERKLDIAHREVDIGIRSHKPEGPSFAVRRTGHVAHAPFRSRQAGAEAAGAWVGVIEDQATTAALRWAGAHHQRDIIVWANSSGGMGDLIRAGVGQGILPCFAGDRDSRLMRAGPAIDELYQEQWLVMHEDDRHIARIRTVIERLHELLVRHRALMEGKRPLGA
jgi:DNA-binding transcriptional LysR family regulator